MSALINRSPASTSPIERHPAARDDLRSATVSLFVSGKSLTILDAGDLSLAVSATCWSRVLQ